VIVDEDLGPSTSANNILENVTIDRERRIAIENWIREMQEDIARLLPPQTKH
jgi:hypothetical protein